METQELKAIRNGLGFSELNFVSKGEGQWLYLSDLIMQMYRQLAARTLLEVTECLARATEALSELAMHFKGCSGPVETTLASWATAPILMACLASAIRTRQQGSQATTILVASGCLETARMAGAAWLDSATRSREYLDTAIAMQE